MSKRHDPTRTSTKQAKAAAEMRGRLKAAYTRVSVLIEALPAKTVTVNKWLALLRLQTNREAYIFDLDAERLNRASAEIRAILAEELTSDDWLFAGYVGPTYQQGAAQSIAAIAPQLKLVIPDAQPLQPWQIPAYRRRYELLRARVFETMQGFSGSVADDLSGVLGRAVIDGLNPRDAVKVIAQRFGVADFRAERIARTEITMALKRAILDESDATVEQYGIRTLQMHVSAFSPTSRQSHMQMHGRLRTSEQVREWYAVDANAINCMCSQVPTLVDDDGEPYAPGLLKRAQTIKDKYQDRIDEATK